MDQGLPLLQELIEHFRKLPGVGEKTARRLAFAILDMDEGEVRGFAEALRRVREEAGSRMNAHKTSARSHEVEQPVFRGVGYFSVSAVEDNYIIAVGFQCDQTVKILHDISILELPGSG